MTGSEGLSRPILCLEHENYYLYGEFIQDIPKRKLYWLRPLALCWADPTASETIVYDLRQGADIFCPQVLFRPALDTEVLPVLIQLNHLKHELEGHDSQTDDRTANQQLQNFIRRLGQAYPQAFRQST